MTANINTNNEAAVHAATVSGLEAVINGSAIKENAAAWAHVIVDSLMRAVKCAIQEEVVPSDSRTHALLALESVRKTVGMVSASITHHYPELAESINNALFVASYAESFAYTRSGGKNAERNAGKDCSVKTYIVKSPASGLIKIGRSISPADRIKSLETGAGTKLNTIAIIPGDREKELHGMFFDLRVFGEWFSDDGSIAEFLRTENKEQ